MAQCAKLSADQINMLGFSTYPGEIVMIDYENRPVTHESFYWNAQEYFSEKQLEEMPWFSTELFEK